MLATLIICQRYNLSRVDDTLSATTLESHDKMLATMNTKTDKFYWVDWMIAEREKREMTQADLARASGLTRSAISDYENRQRANPDIKALASVSIALGYPAEHLKRMAGLLPQEQDIDDEVEQLVTEASKLNDRDREEVLAFIRMKQNFRKKNG